jgi:hypothetical protein
VLACTESSAHRGDSRARRRPMAAIFSCSSSPTATRSRAGLAGGPLPVDRGAGDRTASRGCARGGARKGHRAPRSEAGEHRVHGRRFGEGARLRPGQGRRWRPRRGSHDLTDHHVRRAHAGVGLIFDSSVAIAAERRGDTVSSLSPARHRYGRRPRGRVIAGGCRRTRPRSSPC